jgi:iron complex outermembrane receptor protein
LRLATEQFDAHFLGVDFDGLLPDNRTLLRSAFEDLENAATYYTALELTGRFQTWGIKHTTLLGADYYNEDVDAQFAFPSLTSIDIFNPVHGAPRPDLLFDPGKDATEYYGVYFQDQFDLLNNLHLLGGGRYDWATTESQFGTNPANKTEDQAFSPRVGLVYQPLPWLALYGSYVESFGSENSGLSRTGEAFKPETGTQYEAGLKTELLDRRLSATLAFYHLTKQNVLTPDPVDPNFSVQTGEARSRGIEVDLAGEITPAWSLIAAYAYTDARITQDNSGREGFRVEAVPEHSSSVWTRYRFLRRPLQGLSVGAGVFAAGKRTGFENDFTVPGYARVDALAAYTWQLGPTRVTAQLNVENLLNKEYLATVVSRAEIIPGAPRTFLGSLRIEF